MILANDYFTLSGFQDLLEADCEAVSEPFWRNLLPLLHDAGVPLDSCFFTNASIARTDGEDDPRGRRHGFSFAYFAPACAQFLVKQIEVIEPTVILTLGEYAPQVLAMLCPSLSTLSPWPGFAGIDRSALALHRRVRVEGLERPVPAVALLVHPSYRQLNVRLRTHGSVLGHGAEVQLVKTALRMASEPSSAE